MHERAMECGKKVSPEQMESIKAKSVRQSLLNELEQILEKQTAIVKPEPTIVGKRAAKRIERAKHSAGFANLAAAQGATVDIGKDQREFQSDDGFSIGKQDDSSEGHAGSSTNVADSESSEKHSVSESQANGDEKFEGQVEQQPTPDCTDTATVPTVDVKETTESIVEISHVVTFIKQEGGRECINNYFARATSLGRIVSDLDLEVLLYFNRMLTMPNGNVPHKEAISISADHCCAYLEQSEQEPFSGTSYKTLHEIVRAIAACPLLANRKPSPLPMTAVSPGMERGRSLRTDGQMSTQPQLSSMSQLPISTQLSGRSPILGRSPLSAHSQRLARTQHTAHSQLPAPIQIPVHNQHHFHGQPLTHAQLQARVQIPGHSQLPSRGQLPVRGQVQAHIQLSDAAGPQLGTASHLPVAQGQFPGHGQLGAHGQLSARNPLVTHGHMPANTTLPARQVAISSPMRANGQIPTHNQLSGASELPTHNPALHPAATGNPHDFFSRKPLGRPHAHGDSDASNPSSLVHEVMLLPRRY